MLEGRAGARPGAPRRYVAVAVHHDVEPGLAVGRGEPARRAARCRPSPGTMPGRHDGDEHRHRCGRDPLGSNSAGPGSPTTTRVERVDVQRLGLPGGDRGGDPWIRRELAADAAVRRHEEDGCWSADSSDALHRHSSCSRADALGAGRPRARRSRSRPAAVLGSSVQYGTPTGRVPNSPDLFQTGSPRGVSPLPSSRRAVRAGRYFGVVGPGGLDGPGWWVGSKKHGGWTVDRPRDLLGLPGQHERARSTASRSSGWPLPTACGPRRAGGPRRRAGRAGPDCCPDACWLQPAQRLSRPC